MLGKTIRGDILSEKQFKIVKGDGNNVNKEAYFIQDNYKGCISDGSHWISDDSYWKKEWALINFVLCRQGKALKDAKTEIQFLNSYLVEKGLAEEYIQWKGDIDE